ncbi:hypothetical protein A8135_01905 [Legionella jamestowniensis]|uniref:DUF4239 domain-containing protein n=1 Tax=Legionella jamestowniensis TaxID=455 RepID=A0ABX2XTX1_9GAMM|nr:DUF4239 domain-containing protein [Legionella jamestowniensis]OCH98001.1 hypothetical protein A8135_01905 [Legionella jamestowniensis]
MFRELINTLSVWQLFLINLVMLLSFSVLATYIASYLISKESVDTEYSRSTDSILSIMGSGYGVFLGFVIITLWNHYLYVQKNVYKEADDLSVVVRNLNVFPEKERLPMENSLKQYVHLIRTDEWKMMREGKESDKAWSAMHAMLLAFQNYTPKTAKEALFYRQNMNHLDSFLKERRDRLISIHSILNNELRTALILGAIVIVFLSSLLKAHEGGTMRMLANFCLALVIGFNLTLAFSFDYPLSGSISVSNEPFFEGVLKNF